MPDAQQEAATTVLPRVTERDKVRTERDAAFAAIEHALRAHSFSWHQYDAVFVDTVRGILTLPPAALDEMKAAVLEQFATDLRERYPEDVFRPMTDADHRAVNNALSGRTDHTNVSRDRVSADMMRFAAVQAEERAEEYRNASPRILVEMEEH